MKKENKPISIDGELYNDMSKMLKDLYVALANPPQYTPETSFLSIPNEYSKVFMYFVGALPGAASSNFIDMFLLTSSLTGAMEASYQLKTLMSRRFYHKNLAFLLNSMGSNSDGCANEKMSEIQLCKILKKKSIDFDDIDMENRERIEEIIKDKKLFIKSETVLLERLTLEDTTMDSQINAFRFLHDIYYICKLRRSMTTQYISFIGAHRSGKSSLLKSLWNIPAQRGDLLDKRTQQMQIYTLYDENSGNKVHLMDYSGVTDPVRAIAHLNQNYSVLSTFYVIVVKAGTDFSSAAELIKELRTPPPTIRTTLSGETDQKVSDTNTTIRRELVEHDTSRDQHGTSNKNLSYELHY
jgi:hypothetical protein